MGQPCSEEEMAQLIAEFDVNQNGEIDWPEFLSVRLKQKENNKISIFLYLLLKKQR